MCQGYVSAPPGVLRVFVRKHLVVPMKPDITARVLPVQETRTDNMPPIKLSYTEARANLAKIWDRVIENREAAVLHRRGKEDVVLIPASEFEGLVEAAHLLRSPKNAERLMRALHRALNETGVPSSVDELAAEFGLDRKD